MMNLTEAPVVKTEMLIRRPVEEVFEAFIDPAITSKFWFTKGSGKLTAGARVRWDWEMYGASAEVSVKDIENNKRLVIEFGDGTTVEWTFARQSDNETFVTITNWGFTGSGDDMVKHAIGSTEGFTIVLCGAKALLEHHIALNLVGDKAPYAHVSR